MAYTSSPFTDVPSGQSSAPCVQWLDAPQHVPDASHRPGPSVPLPTTEWHTSDAALPSPDSLYLLYPSTPDSSSTSATSPSSSRASSPGSSSLDSPRPKKKSVSRRSAKDPSHIPRPRNAFILFRSDKCKELRQTDVETDHRLISRIIGDLWSAADDATKKRYKDMAAREKEEHSRLYPGYRFNPQARLVPPKRRNVKRKGANDINRCKLIADLLHKGQNTKLKEEVDQFDKKVKQEMWRNGACESGDPYSSVCDFNTPDSSPTPPLPSPSAASTSGETPFRSPLLPPISSPPTPEADDLDIQGQVDALSALQLDPKYPFDGKMSNPTSLPLASPEMVDNTIFAPPAGFPSPHPSFGAMHPPEQSVLGISNMYPPRVPQFDDATPTNHYHFQDHALFSVDPAFHDPPSYNLDASAQIPEAHLQMAPYQPSFQLQPFPQPQGHPQVQYVDLAYAAGFSANFGIPTPYDAASQGVYSMWTPGQAGGLDASAQAEPAHLGHYMPSF